MAVTDRTIAAMRTARIRLDRTVDAATRDLAQAWSVAWDEIVTDWSAAIDDLIAASATGWPSRSQVLRAKRAQKALDAAADALDSLANQAGVRILRDVSALADDAADMAAKLTSTQIPAGVALASIGFDTVDPETLAAIVKRTTQQVESLTRPLAADAVRAMKSSLIRGIAVGDNPKVAARRMLARTRTDFDGGRYRAEVIARTEMLDAHRAGALASREANADILKGWRWACSLSDRTCPACLGKHGTMHKLDEPGPWGHQSCRCTAVPVTKPYGELGIDAPEPADRFPDADDWLRKQSRATQLRIMGSQRLALLDSGKVSLGDMATLRANPGWRPSWGLTPLADLT